MSDLTITTMGFYLVRGPSLRKDVACIEIVEITEHMGPLYRIHYARGSVSDVEPLSNLLNDSYTRPYFKIPNSFMKWATLQAARSGDADSL